MLIDLLDLLVAELQLLLHALIADQHSSAAAHSAAGAKLREGRHSQKRSHGDCQRYSQRTHDRPPRGREPFAKSRRRPLRRSAEIGTKVQTPFLSLCPARLAVLWIHGNEKSPRAEL